MKYGTLIRRRTFLLGTAAFLAPVNIAYAQSAAVVERYVHQNTEDILELPSVDASVGVLGCDDLRTISTAYRQACSTLNDVRLDDIHAQLTFLTTNEIYKQQSTIDAGNSDAFGARLGLISGLITSLLGAMVIGAGIYFGSFLAGPVLALSTTATIYALFIGPKIAAIQSSYTTDDGKEIVMSFGQGIGSAVAIASAVEIAENSGKAIVGVALKSAAKAVSAAYDVVSGLSDVIENGSSLSTLQQKIDAAAARALELQNAFAPVLSDRGVLRDLLCILTETSADVLERAVNSNNGNNCRFTPMNLNLIRWPEGPQFSPQASNPLRPIAISLG